MRTQHTTYKIQRALKRLFGTRKRRMAALGTLIVFLSGLVFSSFMLSRDVEAGWWDDNWTYRIKVPVTSTNGSAQTDVYISFDSGSTYINTSDTDKFQTDCGDLRFTKENGQVLPYYIVSGCGGASTEVHVLFDTFPDGDMNIYYYYGNSTVHNGGRSSDFDTEASNYTIGSFDSEEAGPGPIAYWKFDEGYGSTTQDKTANNNDLTITNATWSSDDVCYSEKCLSYDGTQDFLSRANDDDFDFTASEDFTITAWVKSKASVSATQMIVARHGTSGSDGGFKVYMDSDGDYSFAVDDDDTWDPDDQAITNEANYDDSKWHHIAAVKNDTTDLRLYIDGQEVAVDDNITATGSLANDDILYVGIDGDGTSNDFTGIIDELKIYRYARSADEIKMDYSGGAAVFGDQSDWLSEGLVGHWKMDENTGTTTSDSSGNGRTGTFANSPDWTTGKFGSGLKVDNSANDAVQLSSILNSSSEVTYAFWMYNTSSENWDGVLGADDSNGIFLGQSDQQVIEVWDATRNLTSTSVVTANSWHHITVTGDGNNSKIFVDGELNNSSTSSVNFPLEYIGSCGTAGGCNGTDFDGYLDEVRVYNRALTPSEVQDLYKWAPGPVAYYSFDEGSGTSTIFDRSGNSHDGSMNGGMTESDWVRGKVGGALDFDGSGDHINVPAHQDFEFNNYFTISLWFSSPTYDCTFYGGNYCTLIGKPAGQQQPDFEFGINASNRFWWQANGISADFTTTTTFNTNEWYHLAVVREGTSLTSGTAKFYLNGVYFDTTDGYMNNTLSDLLIGTDGIMDGCCDKNYWEGAIDDVRIYNYARTPEQIIQDMNAGHPAPGSPIGSAVGHWKFDEGYGDVVYDTGTGGNNGDLGFSGQTCPASGAVPCPTWSNSGKIGKALEFDGTDDDIDGGDQDDLDMGTGDFTISAWVNLDSDVSNTIPTIYEKGGGSLTQAGYWFYYDTSDDTLHLTMGDGINEGERATLESPLNGAVLDDDTWHYVAVVIDRESLTNDAYFYLDGVLVGGEQDNDDAGDSISTSSNFEIGSKDDNANAYWDGHIDEVKVYKFTLTAEQVKTEYNFGQAAVFGATSTDLSGNYSYSSDREYCPPGDTDSNCGAPIAEWKFDDNVGTGSDAVKDTSGNENHGTMESSMTNANWVKGREGNGMNFDGSDDYVDTDSVMPISGANPFSMSAWVNTDDTGDSAANIWKYIAVQMGLHDGDGHSAMLGVMEDRIQFSTYNLGEVTYDPPSPINGEWMHVTATYDGSTVRLYINGVFIDSTDIALNLTSEEIRIGCHGGNTSDHSRFFNGQIDEVRIYDYARTPAQIAWEYNRGGPVGWWKFDECEGETAYDTSGGGNNGTITIGATGDNTSAGTCSSGTGTEAWNNGTNGKRGASLDFDGTNDYVAISDPGSNSIFDFSPGETISIAAWVKPNVNITTYSTLLTKGLTTGVDEYNYWVGFENSNKMAFVYSYGSGSNIQDAKTASGVIQQGVWQHIVFIYEFGSSNVWFYHNTRDIPVDNTISGAFTPDEDNDAIWIGADNWSGGGSIDELFDGQIDDVRIYNYALTQQQINDIYSGGAVRFE